MQAIGDIFQIWPSTKALAQAIEAKEDTVRRWRNHGRIPQTEWLKFIAAAALRGRRVTAEDFLRLNTPMKQRGRPAHRPRSEHNGARRAASVPLKQP